MIVLIYFWHCDCHRMKRLPQIDSHFRISQTIFRAILNLRENELNTVLRTVLANFGHDNLPTLYSLIEGCIKVVKSTRIDKRHARCFFFVFLLHMEFPTQEKLENHTHISVRDRASS